MSEAKPGLGLVEPIDDSGLATLELISQARQALTAARTLPDIRRVMEAASVAQDAAQRAARLFNAERRTVEVVEAATAAANDAAAIRIEAQAKAGELLAQMRESGERAEPGRPGKTSQHATFIDSGGEPRSLRSLGVSRSESSRWQQVADVPEEQRREYVEATKAAKGEVSTAGLLKHVKAGPSTPTGRMPARVEIYSHDRETAESARAQLANELHRVLGSLLTFPAALVKELEGDDLTQLQRTLRRVSLWFGYVTGSLLAGDDRELVDAVHTTVVHVHGLCQDGVSASSVLGAVAKDERPQLLSAVRGLSEWLADLEGELIRQGAVEEAELTDE